MRSSIPEDKKTRKLTWDRLPEVVAEGLAEVRRTLRPEVHQEAEVRRILHREAEAHRIHHRDARQEEEDHHLEAHSRLRHRRTMNRSVVARRVDLETARTLPP
jgi:hypothetical protein